MRLDAAGHPLHTRLLSVTLTARADGKLDVDGAVVDLRKRGFVPVAGDLQGSGIIHDMRLAGLVDPVTRVLAHVSADQRSVAFEPSATTGGESCRDPIRRIEALAGTPLDAGWARRLAGEIGGPRGCSHLLTLGHLLGSTAGWMLDREQALHGTLAARRPGERAFRRDLAIDGHEPSPGRLILAAQLTDLHFAPAPERALPMDRFAEALEVRVLADVDFTTGTIGRITAADRRRGRGDVAGAPWRSRDDDVSWLAGERVGAGITAILLARLGNAADDAPLRDVLLNLAPALVQCAAAMLEVSPALTGLGGLPDSCWMWRRDGALARLREAQGGTGSGRR
jgi:Protein of unknown function (DUF2889)